MSYLLHRELIARVPTLQPINETSVFSLTSLGDEITILTDNDLTPDVVALVDLAVSEHDFTVSDLEEKYRVIRLERIVLLRECDWTQLPDNVLTPEKKSEWRTFRQALRDFPETCNPHNPIYPTPPSELRKNK